MAVMLSKNSLISFTCDDEQNRFKDNEVSMCLVNHSYREEDHQLLISSGQMIEADEELQPITWSCILDQRECAAPQLWRNSHRTSSLVPRPPSFSVPPQHYLLPVEPTHHSTLTSLASFECPNEATWTRLISNMQEIFSIVQKDLNIATQQDAVTENQHNRFIIFCVENIPQQLFGDTYHTEDCRMSIGDTGWRISDKNVLSNLKNSAQWPHGHNANNSKDNQHEDDFNTCNLKSLLKSCNVPGALFGRDKNVKRRKSVSFDDDVMVYLFDQVPFSCCLFRCRLVGFGSTDHSINPNQSYATLSPRNATTNRFIRDT